MLHHDGTLSRSLAYEMKHERSTHGPKVSVITATHARHATLVRAMRSLAAQTFRDWEHVIVADGPDDKLSVLIAKTVAEIGVAYPHRLVELGRCWGKAGGMVNAGGVPKLVGTHLAAGRYVCYLDDDNEFFPDHLASLSARLDANDCDMAYGTAVTVSRDGEPVGTMGGPGPPYRGGLDTGMVMHRWELLLKDNWKSKIYADDWELYSSWLASGAVAAFVDVPVLRYYLK